MSKVSDMLAIVLQSEMKYQPILQKYYQIRLKNHQILQLFFHFIIWFICFQIQSKEKIPRVKMRSIDVKENVKFQVTKNNSEPIVKTIR